LSLLALVMTIFGCPGSAAGDRHRSRDHLMLVIAGSLLALVMVRRSVAMTANSANIVTQA
jgi:hypothetical protein